MWVPEALPESLLSQPVCVMCTKPSSQEDPVTGKPLQWNNMLCLFIHLPSSSPLPTITHEPPKSMTLFQLLLPIRFLFCGRYSDKTKQNNRPKLGIIFDASLFFITHSGFINKSCLFYLQYDHAGPATILFSMDY